MTGSQFGKGWLAWVVGGILVLGALLRLLLLDSDPKNAVWPGYVIDEGLWTEVARELALFGSADFDGLSVLQLMVAPAYQAATALSFFVFGVGFVSARLVSALSGIGLLVAAFVFLRTSLSAQGLAAMLVALALQPDLLFLSRVAIPEAGAMLFEFLAFAVLVSQPGSERRAFIAGLVTTFALAMKATTAAIVPILIVTLLISHRSEGEPTRSRRLGAFLMGIALPATVVIVAGFSISNGWPSLELESNLATIIAFVDLNDPYAAVGTLFHRTYAPELHVFLTPVWLIAGLLVAAGKLPKHPARVIYLGSATWIAGWLLAASMLSYFPERYAHHVFVPLSINIGAGLTLLQVVGMAEIGNGFRAAGRLRRAVGAMWLALPLAVLVSPPVSAMAARVGVNAGSLSIQLATIAILDLLLWGAQHPRGWPAGIRAGLLATPLTFVPLWFALVQWGLLPERFWEMGTMGALLLPVTAVVGFSVIRPVSRPGRPPHALAFAYALGFAVLWLAQVAPWYLAPTYTIADASAAIGELVDDSTVVGAITAGSLFLGNRLRYTEDLDPAAPPEALVVAMFHRRLDESLREEYRVLETRELEFEACPTCGPFDETVMVLGRRR